MPVSDAQVAEIARTLELILERGSVYELRALEVRNGNGRPCTVSGYFDNLNLMAASAAKLSGLGIGVYHTLNPVHGGLLARAANRVAPWPKDTTKDHEIAGRRLLLVDIDPVREGGICGISSTDQEHRAALELALAIADWLDAEGWPLPLIGDSGNGAHLIYRINLKNNDDAMQLVKRVLAVIAERFNDDKATVDVTTFNASRICRIYGTLCSKADDIPERPHRVATLHNVPPEWSVVSQELLEKVANQAPATSDPPNPHTSSAGGSWVERRLEKYQIAVTKIEPYQGGRRFILKCCPFNPNHAGTSAAVFEDAEGKPGFNCFHPECKDKSWTDLRRLFEPDFGKKKADGNRHDAGQPLKTVISDLPDVRKIASEEVEFLVPGVLIKGTLTLLSGEASGGKTTLALWFSDLIARGAEVFGERCQQHPVLYLTKENPVDYMADIARRLNIENGPDSNLYIWGDWTEEAPPAPAASHILQWVSECRESPFVVVDSLIAFFDGQNENDAKEMRAFVNQGRQLMRAGACGVLFLHHPGKAESAREYRGSSDLKPAIDAGYIMHNSGDGILERLHLKLFKPRFLAQKRELLLVYRDGWFVSDDRPTAVQESNAKILTRLLAANPGIGTEDFKRAAQTKGVTQTRARQFLDDGVHCGTIQRETGRHNRHSHTLVEPDDRGTVQ